MKTLKKYRWPLTGALLGALIFLLLYGVRVLDPTSVDWILNNPSPDPAQHYLGWELFRRSPVHLPYIGANYNAVYPFRTSVLFTDSLPLAALLFKLLGGILPTRFQYFGWWAVLLHDAGRAGAGRHCPHRGRAAHIWPWRQEQGRHRHHHEPRPDRQTVGQCVGCGGACALPGADDAHFRP